MLSWLALNNLSFLAIAAENSRGSLQSMDDANPLNLSAE